MSYLKGGKTPPRLLQDLAVYNPNRLPPSGYNVLVELAFPFDDKTKHRKTTAKGSCKHQWTLKTNACTPDVIDPSEPAEKVAGALCLECRCHVTLTLDSRGEGPGVRPCPSAEYPLHHFRYLSKRSKGFQRTDEGLDSWEDTRLFQCTAQQCSARLIVRTRSPRLRKSFAELLTNRGLIEERARKAMAAEPERFEGHAVPLPLTVLTHLKAYISTAMKGEVKYIQAGNKKWLLSLGPACAELLSYLQFSSDDNGWYPPRPDVTDTAPFSSDLKTLLDDVDSELQVLMHKQPEEEKRQSKVHFGFTPAAKEFEKLLASDDYLRAVASRNASQSDDDDEEHPYYGGLGTVLDFHDSLIDFAYSQQCLWDENNSFYYLECLQGIAKGRKSEELLTRVALEASTGKVSMGDIIDAYKSFGLDMDAPHLDDNHIIGNFRSRIIDAPKQESELRRALKIIGQHRQSANIVQVAEDTITNYEQALSWLGASADMDDSFIMNLYGVKVNENPVKTNVARKAMDFIARKRDSKPLRKFLKTGHFVEAQMDAAQAYARLDIGDRTVEDDLVLSAYESAVQDQPSQKEELKRALTAIANDRNSTVLKRFAESGTTETTHVLSEWPVGLDNIGNTCYLNSLYQFYFSIKPLRDLVLNFDDYKVKIQNTSLEKKQVGSRRVSRREVERAQKFVVELQKLWRDMISSNTASVRPNLELARLTLFSSSTEESFRRNSLQSQRPSLGEIGGKPIHGPLPPPIPEDVAREREDSVTIMGDDVQTVQTPVSTMMADEDKSSDSTLVEKPSPMVIDLLEIDQQAKILENKENMAPFKHEVVEPLTPESPFKPLANDSPSGINDQQGTQTPEQSKTNDEVVVPPVAKDPSENIPAPPTRSPPPVPPRNKPLDRREEIKKEVELGTQQDVTEVISNVLFQLQCAIKAESVDQSGEQIDRIKNLFFGKLKITTIAKDGRARTQEEFFSDIKIHITSGPRDIYAALDGAFDVQTVEVGGSKEPQYTSISRLPPILQLHISRVQYNKDTHRSFKANHHLDFQKTIFMDRYVDTEDEELRKRRAECWRWKKELRALNIRRDLLTKNELGITMDEALNRVNKYLNQIEEAQKGDPNPIEEVTEKLKQEVADAEVKASVELKDIEARIKDVSARINSQFSDLRKIPYNLQSVFVHRGDPSGGHYWIFIFDFERKIWRVYNDEKVDEVTDLREVFEPDQSGPRPPTSAYLVYVQEGRELELTDAVCRHIEPGLGSSADMPIQLDESTDETPMQQLSKWSSDLAAYDQDVEMNDASGFGGMEKEGLFRPPKMEGHKNVTW